MSRWPRRVLFVCGKARMRSPTAADFATDFAGLSPDADERISCEQIEGAAAVLVMERRQLARLKAQSGPLLGSRKVAVLGIPDQFGRNDPALVARLTKVLPPHLGPMR